MEKNWTEQRIEWNKHNKCARQACQRTFYKKKFRNSANQLFYCVVCARIIEEANNGQITFESQDVTPPG